MIDVSTSKGKIHTSYLAQVKKLDREKYAPIFIASRWPQYFKDESRFPWCKRLAPPHDLIGAYKRMEIGKDEYVMIYYRRVTDHLQQDDIYAELISLADGKIPVLVCYEADDGSFCHRHLVASWMRNAGYDVSELIY